MARRGGSKKGSHHRGHKGSHRAGHKGGHRGHKGSHAKRNRVRRPQG